eukprot:m.29502 g.29502  ORF g.29502 m.29502 type:complete len:60 (-) comp9171_c0_seq2:1985-2164(-)
MVLADLTFSLDAYLCDWMVADALLTHDRYTTDTHISARHIQHTHNSLYQAPSSSLPTKQ